MASKSKKKLTKPVEQPNGKDESEEKTSGWDKASVIVSIISLIFSIVSIVCAFLVVNYQRDQSIIPNVRFLNQSVRIPFSISDDSNLYDYDGILDYSTIDASSYPIRIPIRNIGVGLAQNCCVEFSIESQISVLEQCRERLEQCCYLSTYGEHKSADFLDGYYFCYEDDKLFYVEYTGCQNHIEHIDYLDTININTFPYILPLQEENEPNYLVLPEHLSAFILETIHQEMIADSYEVFDPIILKGKLSYQDIDGKGYIQDFELRFNKFSNAGIHLIKPEIFMQIESDIT